MTTKKTEHTGKRGRPKNNPPCKKRCVYLTDEQVRLVRIWGRGDISAGLRWLIDASAPKICRATEDNR